MMLVREVEDEIIELLACLDARGITSAVYREGFLELWRAGKYAKAWRLLNRRICGAHRKRDGRPCLASPEPRSCRCRFHGGLSTGAKTIEGKLRIAAAQRERWKKWRLSQALG